MPEITPEQARQRYWLARQRLRALSAERREIVGELQRLNAYFEERGVPKGRRSLMEGKHGE